MSAFSKLLVEAKQIGITGLEFEVTLSQLYEKTGGAECTEDCWKCVGYNMSGMARGYGRTGEEALRGVVTQMKEKFK